MATATKPVIPAPRSTHPTFTITVPRSVVKEALGKLLSVIPTGKVQIPILACVLIEVPDTIDALIARADDAKRPERITCTGTDLEAMVSLGVVAEVTGSGRVALPAKRLLDFAASLPAGASLTITVAGLVATVRSGRSVLTLSGMPVDEFPQLPPIEGRRALTLAKGAFIAAVTTAVRFTSDQDKSRPTLCTVCLAFTAGMLTATATSGHILGRFPAGTADEARAPEEALFPRETVPSFARLFADVPDDATLDFACDEYRARLTASDVTVQFRLVSGPYPKIEQLIPTDPRHLVVCDRDALVAALRRVGLASEDATHRVALTLAPSEGMDGVSELRLSATSDEGGTADDVVLAESHERRAGAGGEPYRFDVNAAKLVTALDSLTGDRVTLSLTAPERAVLLRPADQAPGDPTFTLVMPLRTL